MNTQKTTNPTMFCALNSKEMFPSFDPSVQEKRTGTTFYGDFKVAEAFRRSDPDALDDTWRRAWGEWKNNPDYVVELCLVMNHLCWEHAETDEELSRWYATKYHCCNDRIFSSGDENEPLPEGCRQFTSDEQSFAFDVLD